MNRRDFGRSLMLGGLAAATHSQHLASGRAAALPGPRPATADHDWRQPRKALMHVGCQWGDPTDEMLAFKKRHGVNNIDGGTPTFTPDLGWDYDEIMRTKERCERHGISLDAFHMPLSSGGIEKQDLPNIMLGRSPERDREIEIIHQIIRTAAKADVRRLLYNLIILPVLRTGKTPGRGGSSYNTWNVTEAGNAPLTPAGRVSPDEMWERITYFLERVIPVAEENKVYLGCHLPDPPTPSGHRGLTRVLGARRGEGLRQFVKIVESPYHGFNFCVGSVAEGLEHPNEEVHDLIRTFGKQKKIFNIHLRNIIGKRDRFMEVYPDNGDIDFVRVVRTLAEVEYPFMIMPDHVPGHPDPASRHQAFAFAYGHIIALIQAANQA